MKKKIIATLMLAGSCTALAADSKPAFSCDQIKDSKVRTTCIESMKVQTNDAMQTTMQPPVKPAESTLDSARQALKAFKKLEARVSTGISYRDYPAALADAKVEAEQFAGSRAAEGVPDVANLIRMIALRYEEALVLWNYKFRKDGIYQTVTSNITESSGDGFFTARTTTVRVDPKMQAYIGSLNAAYPSIASNPAWGDGKTIFPPDYPKTGTMIGIDAGISIIWAKASSDVANLSAMLR
jgi:hypothetical protein